MLLKFLPAFAGDCILINWQGESGIQRTLLIDGGTKAAYLKELRKELQHHPALDLLVVTHIDNDHIGGILSLSRDIQAGHFSNDFIRSCWFNSGGLLQTYFGENLSENRELIIQHTSTQLSVKQGITFAEFLERFAISTNQAPIATGSTYTLDGLTLKVLSPSKKGLERLNHKWQTEQGDKEPALLSSSESDYAYSILELAALPFEEDTSLPNKSSIALLLTYNHKKTLLLADAHPSVIVEALRAEGYSSSNKLCVDLVKVSHHGSRSNTSDELLELLDCSRFVICSNRTKHGHPHKEALARIITQANQKNESVELLFTYPVFSDIFSTEDTKSHLFTCSHQNHIQL